MQLRPVVCILTRPFDRYLRLHPAHPLALLAAIQKDHAYTTRLTTVRALDEEPQRAGRLEDFRNFYRLQLRLLLRSSAV